MEIGNIFFAIIMDLEDFNLPIIEEEEMLRPIPLME